MEASWLVHACALANGSVAFGLANSLAGDTVLITGVSLYMIYRLGKLYGVADVNGKQIVTQIVTHYAAPLIGAKLLFWVPGIGNWANALSMSLLTEIIGWTCILLFKKGENPDDLSAADWESLIRSARRQAKQHQVANKALLKAMTVSERTRFTKLNKQLADDTLSREAHERIFQQLIDLYIRVSSRVELDGLE